MSLRLSLTYFDKKVLLLKLIKLIFKKLVLKKILQLYYFILNVNTIYYSLSKYKIF